MVADLMDVRDKVLNEIWVQCQEEFVEVWAVLWSVRYHLCGGDYPIDVFARTDPDQVRQLAQDVIREVLERGARAGFYADAPDAYPPPLWDHPPDVAFQRLEEEWDRMEREPSMNELAGFSTLKL